MRNYVRPAIASAITALVMAAPLVQSEERRDAGNDNKQVCQSEKSRQDELLVIGLTEDQRLICFREDKPQNAREIGAVRGVASGDSLIGIDYRVQDGKLYGVSRTGAIYILDTATGNATKTSQLTVALEGNAFGVDFNPAADRLRIVSDTGQNLRHNVNAGGTTLVDDPLDYPPATPVNAVGPNATGVTGAAYTNNDLDPSTGTTLLVLDQAMDQIALQSPPNNGTLASIGKLGVDAITNVSFDIYSTVKNNVTTNVQGLASFQGTDGQGVLYGINLATGKATPRGSFAPQNKVLGIAIPLNQM